MPVDRDIDSQGREGRIKIYPPQIAVWFRRRREAHRRLKQLPSSLPAGNRGNSRAGNIVGLPK
jgi:hypothetical protein